MNKTTLHFFCGKMAAGKSTLAKKLAEKHQAILLVEDEWLETLYPEEITSIPDYINYSSRLKEVLIEHIKTILQSGVSVVLDFPANMKNQRLWFRSLIDDSGVEHTLHYVDKSDDVCKQQLKLRSQGKPEGTAFTTNEEFDAISQYFQAPKISENFNIVKCEV